MGWDGATMGRMHKEAVSRYLMFREVSQARKQPIINKHICGPIW